MEIPLHTPKSAVQAGLIWPKSPISGSTPWISPINPRFPAYKAINSYIEAILIGYRRDEAGIDWSSSPRSTSPMGDVLYH
jgi:hypothetical protein